MRKNITLISLFFLLAFSLFLNLAAYGERIRLNGTISEMTRGSEYDYEYINSQADSNNALLNYCNNQKEINAATLKNEEKRLMDAVELLPRLVEEVDKTASRTAHIRQERLDFINNMKYAVKVDKPRNLIE